MAAFHARTPEEVVRALATDPERGLSSEEAERRLRRYGKNVLPRREGRSPLAILLGQFASPLVAVLIAAASVSFSLGEVREALAVLAILLLNALLGFFQEYRAERALLALQRLAVPRVRVLRDGRVALVPATELVPGDVILLEAGDVVPADARLIEAVDLAVEEAALTGESVLVEKAVDPVPEDAPLPERKSMVYLGTAVVRGRARAVVVATGPRTELGRIARMLGGVRRAPSPLERRLRALGRQLTLLAAGVIALVVVLGLLRGEDVRTLFLTGVSLAVAAIPEGLPAVVTITLALGAVRMLKKNALVRRLPAVETLGSTGVICTDKTGTLTQNRMTAVRAYVDGRVYELEPARPDPRLEALFLPLVLANAAGDPMELALLRAAEELGLERDALLARWPKLAEVPFSSERKRTATLHRVPEAGRPAGVQGPFVLFVKGAPDVVLERASHLWTPDGPRPLDDAARAELSAVHDRLAGEGLRLLAAAYRSLKAPPDRLEAAEEGLVFVGLVGLVDPLRPEVKPAIEECRRAGIRVVMVTGDHPRTALAVARQLGLEAPRVLTGRELDALDEAELARLAPEVGVYARVVPEHKLKIVAAWQRLRRVVAMTGDGVNDAPALKKADIGVAMGSGTEVAREAAEMVLLDDNFATIVAAVREGRRVYDNVRRFVLYTLSSNAAEIGAVVLAPFLGMPLPLYPIQILWINLVTDGLPGLALAVEREEEDVMRRPPRRPDESPLSGFVGRAAVFLGLGMTLASLLAGALYWHAGREEWRTMLFSVLTFSQLANALVLRSFRTPIARLGWFSNPWLLAAVASSVALQLAVIYAPALQAVFHTAALPLGDLLFALALSLAVPLAFEGVKARHGSKPSPT